MKIEAQTKKIVFLLKKERVFCFILAKGKN